MQALRDRRKERGLSLQQVGDAMGLSPSTISLYESGRRRPNHETLRRLAAFFSVTTDHLLGCEHLRQLGLQAEPLLPQPLVPIYGRILAGHPRLANEEIEGHYPADVDDPEQYFYLRVQGDSMRDAGIRDGSLVLMRSQNYAESGKIVAVLVDGEAATLKRFKRSGRLVALLPENAAYSPILLSTEEFDCGRARILGVAVRVTSDL